MHIKLWLDREIQVEKKRVGRVPVLILRPTQPAAGKPGVLWIHGGGYITGMKEMVYMSRAADLVKKYGVTVVSPGYRLAWLHPWPAAAEDCFAVLQFMDEKRERLGFSSLMVGGESAGGGLTAAVCMMARDRGIRVAFQMPLYPMLSNIDTESSGTTTEKYGTPGAITSAGGCTCAGRPGRRCRPMPRPSTRPIITICRNATPLWVKASPSMPKRCNT